MTNCLPTTHHPFTKNLNIDLCDLTALNQQDYVLLGNSDSISAFHTLIKDTSAKPPIRTLFSDGNASDTSLAQFDPTSTSVVVTSTSNKVEMLSAIAHIEKYRILDISAAMLNNWSFYHDAPQIPYIILFCTNPVDRHPMWSHAFQTWLNEQGIRLIYRHPLQRVDSNLLAQSEGVVFWGGSISCFDLIKRQLQDLDIPYSFCECGFFPQADYMYFDPCGINVESALAGDDLAWLPTDYLSILSQKRQEFFDPIPAYSELKDYTFIPLQMAKDSNIQSHSRFTQGMQEFIDYIENLYPNETLIFKAHPRDPSHYQLNAKNSSWSNASSQSLIKSAKRVHGINSTVLFEAALFGVEVITEGDSLLVRHQHQYDKLLAAMILRQCNVKKGDFSKAKLTQFSHLTFED